MNKFLIVFLLSIQVTFPQSAENQALIDKGIDFYLEQNLKKAEEAFLFGLKKSIESKDSVGVLSSFASLYSCLSMQDKPLDFLKYEKEINQYAVAKNKFSCYTLQELGHVYRSMGEFEQAKKYYERAILKYRSLNSNDYRLSGTGYSAFGSLASETGDYDTAIFYTKQALQELLKQKEIDEPNEIAVACIRLASSFTTKQQFKAAKQYLNQGIQYAIQPSVQVNLYNSLAETYLPENLNNPDSTRFYLKKAINIAQTEGLNSRLGLAYLHAANLEIQTASFAKATIYLNNATTIFEKLQNKLRLGQIYNLKGQLSEKQKNYAAASNHFKQAEVHFSDGLENHAIEKIPYKNEAIKAINGRIENLLRIYQESKQENLIKEAFGLSKKVDEIIDYQRNSFQLEASKVFLTQLSHTVYANTIEVCFRLFQTTKNDSFLQEAFRFSEKNKAIVLYESLKFSQVQNFNGVPQALIQQEITLNKQIAFYGNLIYRDEKKKPSQVAASRIRLLKTNEALEKLKLLFKINYPAYFKFKYDTEPISAKELSSKLTDNEAIIEYFINDGQLYTFLISKNRNYFFKQTLTADFKQSLIDFKNLLVAKAVSENYQKLSFGIYNTLFANEIKQILTSEKIYNLKIIVDGELNYIPFESLLTKSPKSLKDEQIYLIEQFTISYLPSATMNWKSVKPKNDNWISSKYVGFAPAYAKQIDLPYNQANVAYLAGFFKGESYIKEAATKVKFEGESQKATNILHLSMHAGASLTDPMESYLVFGKDSLFVHSIYAKSIPADLSILDACETGVGTLNNGEGVMNLSRAFLHAGSLAVAMSLWKLTSSPETAEIIKDFVGLVQAGKPKDEALRTAKLNFLRAHRKDMVLSHPFYWSPLLLVGNASPIAASHWLLWLLGGLGLALLAAGFMNYFRKKT